MLRREGSKHSKSTQLSTAGTQPAPSCQSRIAALYFCHGAKSPRKPSSTRSINIIHRPSMYPDSRRIIKFPNIQDCDARSARLLPRLTTRTFPRVICQGRGRACPESFALDQKGPR